MTLAASRLFVQASERVERCLGAADGFGNAALFATNAGPNTENTAFRNYAENAFTLPDGKAAHVCMGPTMDMQILRELERQPRGAHRPPAPRPRR